MITNLKNLFELGFLIFILSIAGFILSFTIQLFITILVRARDKQKAKALSKGNRRKFK